MTAKSSTERNRERRARMNAIGFTNCSVYAHPKDHKAIRDLARELGKKRTKEKS